MPLIYYLLIFLFILLSFIILVNVTAVSCPSPKQVNLRHVYKKAVDKQTILLDFLHILRRQPNSIRGSGLTNHRTSPSILLTGISLKCLVRRIIYRLDQPITALRIARVCCKDKLELITLYSCRKLLGIDDKTVFPVTKLAFSFPNWFGIWRGLTK